MKIDPQIPIGKAVDDVQDDDDAEVTAHGPIFDRGEPSACVSTESKETGADDAPEGEGCRLVRATE